MGDQGDVAEGAVAFGDISDGVGYLCNQHSTGTQLATEGFSNV